MRERLAAVGIGVEIQHRVHDRKINGLQAGKKCLALRGGNGGHRIAAAVAALARTALFVRGNGRGHTASAINSVITIHHGSILLSMRLYALPRFRRGRGGQAHGRSFRVAGRAHGHRDFGSFAGENKPYRGGDFQVPSVALVCRQGSFVRSAGDRARIALYGRAYGGAFRLRSDLLGFGCRCPYTL